MGREVHNVGRRLNGRVHEDSKPTARPEQEFGSFLTEHRRDLTGVKARPGEIRPIMESRAAGKFPDDICSKFQRIPHSRAVGRHDRHGCRLPGFDAVERSINP